MSWMEKLYQTYKAGVKLDLPEGEKLIPIAHTLQNAHINIIISINGEFKRAQVLEKTQVILPATEKSAGRSSGEAPHPLADKLQYVAKDYGFYGGIKKPYFTGYQQQLKAWCQSDFKNSKVMAVYEYISKGSVIKDLVENDVLYVGDDGNLLKTWPSDRVQEQPAIFKVLPKTNKQTDQGSALVCWSVEEDGDPNSKTWLDDDIYMSWIKFYGLSGKNQGLCYVTGHESSLAVSHPAKLRHTGDKAKLISANDFSGFTFKGRFTDSSTTKNQGLQAVGIGSDVTQMAHNALSWLINRQGSRDDTQVYVTWAVNGIEPPKPLASSWDLLSDEIGQEEYVDNEQSKDHTKDLGEQFAISFNKYLAGYRAKFEDSDQILVIGLDSATPGRMGVIYYRELLASDFLDRINTWHNDFAWPQRYKKKESESSGKKRSKEKVIWPVASPVPWSIAEAAFGNVLKSNKTLKKSTLERILPCIIDGASFPKDIMINAVRRASNPNSCDHWEWERNVGIACALFKGFYKRHPDKNVRRTYNMSLEESRTTKDYLYGRLLAIAERIESIALHVAGENRTTNAERLMQRFADRPYTTWRTIELSLQPYMQRLRSSRAGFLVNIQKELDNVLSLFDPNDYISDKPLTGEFLLGYHCQRQIKHKIDVETTNTNNVGETK